jgi:EPS-associated MarR family transcriptional regulator
MNCALQGGSVSNQLNSNHEIHLKVLREIEGNPEITQRELAQHLGVSLGKVNYCLKALIDRGWVKANNFKNSNKKVAYAYLLTPNGLEEKAKITVRFLKQRMRDFELIKKEIAELEAEVGGASDRNR